MIKRFLRAIGLSLDLPDVVIGIVVVLLGLTVLLGVLWGVAISRRRWLNLAQPWAQQLQLDQPLEVLQTVVSPYRGWLLAAVAATGVDLLVLANPMPPWLVGLEGLLSFLLAVSVTLLGFKLFSELFDTYVLGATLEEEAKINTELLTLGKFVSKAAIVLVVVFFYAQAHRYNLVGLFASLGVGGFAIAFGSQKIVEQILWSIVLYIDRPFTVGDHIHLPDRTLGKVESTGWRSTKIRLSGKNTLMVVPNSNLAQVSIENLTNAQRVISMVTLTFPRSMANEEQALIEQLLLESSRDILGIDHQLTQVTFEPLSDPSGQAYVQAQVIFFILGATATSMELRKGLLEMARENIIQQLQVYDISFDIKESIIDINQPMNV
ncbi:putative Small Conductance Mechanosensitive Ion Channel protein [Halomicronema hongdechloris C2206]|uniref:Small Conductance Mechanosensitive Ion Channel protein n=1 Tax=Halomicronema hongdechloris C2206 TaxID=1641165 RepID=A0A1Z3HMS6_9CYAN|nr:mechanosensitive ion channel domain-containing protein [Halomicronema hongdechloris]ASC71602.1 putative Small Conductance Mechanosensitive Ion Channel protein [Halomicronema hongdechloris C2206]